MRRLALQKLWDSIPDVGCKGLCQESCGPVMASPLEATILKAHGLDLDPESVLVDMVGDGIPDCPALKDGRCSVYDVRPTVCRLWGATEGMPCPWGCEPAGGLLTDAEGFGLIHAAERL